MYSLCFSCGNMRSGRMVDGSLTRTLLNKSIFHATVRMCRVLRTVQRPLRAPPLPPLHPLFGNEQRALRSYCTVAIQSTSYVLRNHLQGSDVLRWCRLVGHDERSKSNISAHLKRKQIFSAHMLFCPLQPIYFSTSEPRILISAHLNLEFSSQHI
jgi:hypothetical protein